MLKKISRYDSQLKPFTERRSGRNYMDSTTENKATTKFSYKLEISKRLRQLANRYLSLQEANVAAHYITKVRCAWYKVITGTLQHITEITKQLHDIFKLILATPCFNVAIYYVGVYTLDRGIVSEPLFANLYFWNLGGFKNDTKLNSTD